jgi:steroid 5-alpha reductase family enzyme
MGTVMIVAILAAAVALSLIMALSWAFQRKVGNAGWVDAFWTGGMGIAGTALALAPFGDAWPTPRQLLVGALAAIWSIRLGSYLAVRASKGPEDVRYASFRTEWGPRFERNLFLFLQIQAFAATLLVSAILLAARNPAPGLRAADIAGALILAVAIAGEGVADGQLRRFKADPANRGRVCDAGLWGWSRHPNYFFEWLVWLAYPVIAIDPSGAYPLGWLALIAPLFMLWLLLKVSGIPPLEAQMIRSRGTAYRAYQRRTSAFFPWPPAARPSFNLHELSDHEP